MMIRMIAKILTIVTLLICLTALSAQDEPAKLEIGFSASTFFDINIEDGRAATEILTRKLATKMGLTIKTETIIFHKTDRSGVRCLCAPLPPVGN